MWLDCDGAPWVLEVRTALTRDGFGLVDGPPCDLAVLEPPRRTDGVRAVVAVVPRLAPEAIVAQAYDDGADQVLEAPVHAREVVARLRAIARRVPSVPMGDRRLDPHGGVVVDLPTCTATVDGRKVDLTPEEAALLQALVARDGGLVSRDELRAHLSVGAHSRSIDAVVRCVRAKLEQVEGWRRLIAVRGLGFRLLRDR